ncbi:MAG: WS/DGAT domain-containing protein, partial [Candidatus Sulfotelmatobacter sp.]
VQGLAGPIASQLPITPFNLVCTNVPGPQSPLYLLGHKMLEWYPYVPVGGEMAVNCAILSYDGRIYFGFSGDVHAAPDLKRMEKLLQISFTELREAVGLRPPGKDKTRKKRRAVPAAAVPAEPEKREISVAIAAPPAEVKRKPEPAPSLRAENVLPEVVVA